MINCAIDINGCLACPEIPAVPAVPPSTSTRPIVGWDSGANSIGAQDGDAALDFTMVAGVSGAVVGFKGTRTSQTNPSLITHGWYFATIGGHDSAQPMESGVLRGVARAHSAADVFTIARSGSKIVYLVNGNAVLFSTVASTGTILVNACLYTSGDTIGAGA